MLSNVSLLYVSLSVHRESVVSSLAREIQAVPVTDSSTTMSVSNIIQEENINRSAAGTPEPVTSTTEPTEVRIF